MAEIEKYADPTAFRISTITTTASIGVELNLDILYDHLDINENAITFIEYGKKKQDTVHKGFSKKFLINRRRKKPAKRFDNQLTIVYRISETTSANMKLFKNGKIQMTGIKDAEQGNTMVDTLVTIIRNIYDKHDKDIIDDVTQLQNLNYKICLINSDYRIGFQIKRDNLFKLMLSNYNNIASYEPCIYPGVKIQYFWNSISEKKDGVCMCSKKCYHKKKSGDGYGDSNCKKITIAVFQSGSVIITGSQVNSQIKECYSFINDILYQNADKIVKKDFKLEDLQLC